MRMCLKHNPQSRYHKGKLQILMSIFKSKKFFETTKWKIINIPAISEETHYMPKTL